MEFQSFNRYSTGQNPYGVWIDDCSFLEDEDLDEKLYLFTHHQINYGSTLEQTRSSPNWDGGIVTFATCKHHMRTFNNLWRGMWLSGLCPASLDNAVLYCGRIDKVFDSNYKLSRWLKKNNPEAFIKKQANKNPRGDLYQPIKDLEGDAVFDHRNYKEPKNHTRSLEYYKRSTGSISTRSDGKIPKWWRDIEHAKMPKSFILNPVVLFTTPNTYTDYVPGRATLAITVGKLLASLKKHK